LLRSRRQAFVACLAQYAPQLEAIYLGTLRGGLKLEHVDQATIYAQQPDSDLLLSLLQPTTDKHKGLQDDCEIPAPKEPESILVEHRGSQQSESIATQAGTNKDSAFKLFDSSSPDLSNDLHGPPIDPDKGVELSEGSALRRPGSQRPEPLTLQRTPPDQSSQTAAERGLGDAGGRQKCRAEKDECCDLSVRRSSARILNQSFSPRFPSNPAAGPTTAPTLKLAVEAKAHKAVKTAQKRASSPASPKSDIVELQRPPLSPELETVLSDIQGAGTTILAVQIEHWKKTRCLPVNQETMQNVGALISQLQRHPDFRQHGGFLLQPPPRLQGSRPWVRSSVKVSTVSIRTVNTSPKGAKIEMWSPVSCATNDVPLGDLLPAADVLPRKPMDIDQLEQKLRCNAVKSQTVRYARDLAKNDVFPPQDPDCRFESRISRLVGDRLPGNILEVDEKLAFRDPPERAFIDGVNKEYLYVGERGAPFAMHLEDAKLCSLSDLEQGSKGWLFVYPEDREKLESQFRRIWELKAVKFKRDFGSGWSPPTCSQVSLPFQRARVLSAS